MRYFGSLVRALGSALYVLEWCSHGLESCVCGANSFHAIARVSPAKQQTRTVYNWNFGFEFDQVTS